MLQSKFIVAVAIILMVVSLVGAIFVQWKWRLLITQKPAEVISHSTTTISDGRVIDTTSAVGYPVKIRWGIILLFGLVFFAGACGLYFVRRY